jgi:prophage antirepressor-like protein
MDKQQVLRVESWQGHLIRFVDRSGEWLGVAMDIAQALNYSDTKQMTKRIPQKYAWTVKMQVQGQDRKALVLSEFGIYKAIFGSHKPEAAQFQEWVFGVLKALREGAGLAGYEAFLMLDKQHQRAMMSQLSHSKKDPQPKDFMKANAIADKAVSTMYGYPKMQKKGSMSPAMLKARQPILSDTVELMGVKDRFGLNISISAAVYKKYSSVAADPERGPEP